MTDACAPSSIDDEIAIAHDALKVGDLGHAAFHIAAALVLQPSQPEVLAVFDGWFALADNPLGLLTNRDRPDWEGWFAMRARAHAKLGNSAEALPLLAELAAFAPEKNYLTWLPLLTNAGRLEDEVVRRASAKFLKLAVQLREPIESAVIRATAEAALAFLAEWRETKRKLPEPLHASTVLLRKLGRMGEAVAAAHALFALRPDWHSAATLSSTLRMAGDQQGALKVAREGAELAPDDMRAAPLLDVGDLCLELGRPSEARQAYEASLALEPDSYWGKASRLYASFLERGDVADRVALRELVVAYPDEARGRQLLGEIGEEIIDKPCWPSDASANALRQVRDAYLETPPTEAIHISMTLSAPEGPSNLLAGKAMAQAFGQGFAVDLSISSIPTPDPREPLSGAEHLLWRRAGEALEVALDPPDPAVAQEVGAIAATPYNLVLWADRARILGEALGPERASELVATFVHPPPMAHAKLDAPFWVQSVQVAAALAIAHVDRGWEGSVRRTALLAIARGPVDWTVTAAIVALSWVARHEPRSLPEIEALFQALRARESRSAGCTYDLPLRHVWSQLPGLAPETRAMLRREITELSGEAEPPVALAPSEPASSRGRGARLAAWALGLSALFFVPRILPAALGDAGRVFVSMAVVGGAIWLWASSVKPATRTGA